MIFERFETAVVPFPFAEIPVLKRRPVVVLSSATFNASHGVTLVGMITTSRREDWPTDVEITEPELAGLHRACRIRLRLTTLPNDLIIRRLGRLGAVDQLACESAFARMALG